MNWLEVPLPERVEIIRQGLAKKLTYREIAEQFHGATKNSVLSLARRVYLHHGNADEFILTDRRRKKYPLSKEAHERYNKYKMSLRRRKGMIKGYKGATHKKKFINKADDPLTRRAVSVVNASGLTDDMVAERAGINRATIGQWRQGHHKAYTYLAHCVIEAVEQITGNIQNG